MLLPPKTFLLIFISNEVEGIAREIVMILMLGSSSVQDFKDEVL